jgi:hypothetical protein
MEAGLDVMVVAPDKSQSTLIETKLVHDNTLNSYRARAPRHGKSIAGDVEKLRGIPAKPGRSRILMVVMVSILGTETSADWKKWLADVSPLGDLSWCRIESGDGPLFALSTKGWFDIFIHKLD